MSELCEHPLCTRSISTKCSNHCQLDLCQEHITEHKNLFLVQYEKSVNQLNKSLNELRNSIEEMRTNLNLNYEKEISLLKENHQNKFNETQQKSLLISSTENLIKKKLQLLADVKNDQALLYQYDIEQVKLYQTKIREHHQEKTITETDENNIEMSSSSSSSPPSDSDDDESYHYSLDANRKRDDIIHFRGSCPLTHLGIYGLNSKHNLRLCSSAQNKSDRHLMTHFHHYHHLTRPISYELTKAIIKKSNPLTTCVFRSELNIIDKRFYVIRCPLKQMNLSQCNNKFFKDSLKQHLINVHRLTLETSNKIVETMKNKGDLTKLEIDENEFK